MSTQKGLRGKQLAAQEAATTATPAAPVPPKPKAPEKTMSYSDFFYPRTKKATPYKAGGMVKGKKPC
jgi:hypothetical protein